MAHENTTTTLTESSAGVTRQPYDRGSDPSTRNTTVPRGFMIYSVKDAAITAPTAGNTKSHQIKCVMDDKFAYQIRFLTCGIVSADSTMGYVNTATLRVIQWQPSEVFTGAIQIQSNGNTQAYVSTTSVISAKAWTLDKPIPYMLLTPTGSSLQTLFDISTGSGISAAAQTMNFTMILDYFDIEQYYSGYHKDIQNVGNT